MVITLTRITSMQWLHWQSPMDKKQLSSHTSMTQ